MSGQTTPCTSCGAPIVFVLSAKKRRRIPCDPDLVELVADVHGKEVVITDAGEYQRGWTPTAAAKDREARRVVGRISHFATCPHADKHRKGRRKR